MKSEVGGNMRTHLMFVKLAAVSCFFAINARCESWFEEITPASRAIVSVSTREKDDVVEFTVSFPKENPSKVTLMIQDDEKRNVFEGQVALSDKPNSFVAVFAVSKKFLKHSRCDVPVEIDGGRGHAYYHFMLSSFAKAESDNKENASNKPEFGRGLVPLTREELIAAARQHALQSDTCKAFLKKISAEFRVDTTRPLSEVDVNEKTRTVRFIHNLIPQDGPRFVIQVQMNEDGSLRGLETRTESPNVIPIVDPVKKK